MPRTDQHSADDVLVYIDHYTREVGFPPSMREIAAGLGIKAASTVLHHLRTLEDAKKIVRNPKTARGIRIVAGGVE